MSEEKKKPTKEKPFRAGMPPGVGNLLFGIVLLGAGVGVTLYSGAVVWWGAMLVGGFEIVYGLYRIVRC